MILVLTFSTYCLSVVVRVSHTSIFSHIFNITFFIFFPFLFSSCLVFLSHHFPSVLFFFLFSFSAARSMYPCFVRLSDTIRLWYRVKRLERRKEEEEEEMMKRQVHPHRHTSIYIHTYINICTYTHTHMYTHTYAYT